MINFFYKQYHPSLRNQLSLHEISFVAPIEMISAFMIYIDDLA